MLFLSTAEYSGTVFPIQNNLAKVTEALISSLSQVITTPASDSIRSLAEYGRKRTRQSVLFHLCHFRKFPSFLFWSFIGGIFLLFDSSK